MYIPGQPEVNRQLALVAARLWELDPHTIEHIGDFGNSVYQAQRDGERLILRLTEPSFRSLAENRAELDYILHLHSCGVRVSVPLASRAGAWVEQVRVGERMLLASVFLFAPGASVDSQSAHWGEPFFRAWGHALGSIHRASRSFEPGVDRRWHWQDEVLFANARALIPVGDLGSLRELEALMGWAEQLPVDDTNFGMTHADFGPRNFNYHPELGITAFDFGNCCYHWYISDLAIALSTLRRLPHDERERYREWMLAGYREVYPIDPALLAELDQFSRLRMLYVYLDRLMLFGPSPTEEQRRTP